MRCATDSTESTSSAISIRRILAKLLISTGMRLPLGFSNNNAGPLFLTDRSANSVISRYGSTSSEMRFRSFFFSSALMKSRRSLYAIQVLLFWKFTLMTNRTAFITGASRGIGRACALALSEAGARVALAARNTAQLEELASEIRSQGREAFAVTVDMASAESIQEAFAKTAKEFGSVAILVNNAGITKDGLALRMKKDDWDSV